VSLPNDILGYTSVTDRQTTIRLRLHSFAVADITGAFRDAG